MSSYRRISKPLNQTNATIPLKKTAEYKGIQTFFKNEREYAKTPIKKYQADRNYMLCLLGFSTAFRAEDLLQLRVRDLESGYISIKENKTKKNQIFGMDKRLHEDILSYIERNHLSEDDYMFYGQNNRMMPITKTQANRVLKRGAKGINLKCRFSLHSMRKTFGYHYYKQKGKLATLMKMYNHDDPNVTLLYICWDTNDAEKDRGSIYMG